MTIIQDYAPTSDYDDSEVEDFYGQLQEVIEEMPEKDNLIVLGDWNAKVGKDAQNNWQDTCGPFCNAETNERGHKHLEFGKHHNQIDYILVKRRFHTGVNIARTRSFPGADIGSDHDLLMKIFHIRLKRISKPKPTRIKFDIEKLKDPDVAEAFKAMIGGKFAPLIILDDKYTDVNLLTNTFNKIMIDTASEILGKHRRTKKPWVTADILDLCDKRMELKRRKCDPEGAAKYREVNRKIKQDMRRAKDNWIAKQCCEIEHSLSKNNSKKAYQIVKDLTSVKKGITTTIQDKSGKCLTEEQQILNRWTEYCSELYSHNTNGDPVVLNCPQTTEDDDYPIFREEVEAAVKSLKKGKSAGIDNIPAELVQAGGEALITTLDYHIYNNLQQDLADRRMAHPMDSVTDHHTSQERQPTDVPKLQNNQPHQTPEQSHVENTTKQTQTPGRRDHR